MRFYCISDNVDTQVGLRLVGIEGQVVHKRREFLELLETKLKDDSIGIILITTNLIELERERISRIYQMHANKQNPMETVGAGDICAAVGFKEIRTGDTLCAENAPIVLEQMTFPEPVIGLAVEPSNCCESR